MNCLEYLREFFKVLFDKLNTLMRVLPMAANVVGPSCKLVVVVVVVQIHWTFIWVLHKPNEARNVQSLREILDIQAEINYRLFSIFRVAVADQERTCDSANNSTFELKLGFNVLVAVEYLPFQKLFWVLLQHSLNKLLAHKGVVHFGLFFKFVKGNVYCPFALIYFVDNSDQT